MGGAVDGLAQVQAQVPVDGMFPPQIKDQNSVYVSASSPGLEGHTNKQGRREVQPAELRTGESG